MPDLSTPLFGIAPQAKFPGRYDLDDDTPLMAVASFEETFLEPWDSDAHFVTYMPVGDDDAVEQGWPRCNKVLLPKIREHGADLMVHSFVLDWDTPNHNAWGVDVTPDEFHYQLGKATEKFDLLELASVVYYTKNGARLVYLLDELIPADQAQKNLRWFINKARAAGLMVDMLCDWTRLFRMPCVVRDGEPTWEGEYFDVIIRDDRRLPVHTLGEAGPLESHEALPAREIDEDKPTDEQAHMLLYEMNDKGSFVPTDWLKEVRRRLKNRDCYGAIFEGAPIGKQGSRNNNIHKFVGQAIGLLVGLEGSNPQRVYSLFLESVSGLEPDTETPDWTDVLWSSVCRLWAQEEAKEEFKAAREAKAEQEAKEATDDMLQGMRLWCNHESLHVEDEDDARLWMTGRLIVSAGTNFYIMGKDGKYRPQCYSERQLISAIRKHIPSDIIPTIVPTASGDSMKEVSTTSLINRYATVVDEIVSEPGLEGGYIRNIDSPGATLVVPSYRRNPRLTPRFDEQVDEWMRRLFGKGYDDACRWVAYALAFEEGSTCAISIAGDPGVGKKLFAQGLAECLEYPVLATDADIVGDYQYGLLRSPFLLVNEGWTASGLSGKQPADRFRELVAGDPFPVQRKYREPVMVRNPVRAIFTANNLDVIRALAGKGDLSLEDREALSIRLMHFDVGDSAAVWLREKGGMRFTSGPGRHWITPDGKGDSDFVVARHFMWLYERRSSWPRGERFLVEGNGSERLMYEMHTKTGTAPLVIESVLKLIESPDLSTRKGIIVDDNQGIYVVVSEIVDYFRKRLSQSTKGEALTTKSASAALEGLSVESPAYPWAVQGHPQRGKKRWHELDLTKLREAAEEFGWSTDKIEKIQRNKIRRRKQK